MTNKTKINLKTLADELLQIKTEVDEICNSFESERYQNPLEKVIESAKEVGKAWSGSWIGYHANVYYEGLKPPPPGAHFSSEWGSRDAVFNYDTSGNWVEYDFEGVRKKIFEISGVSDLSDSRELAEKAEKLFKEKLPSVLSILESAVETKEDNFLRKKLSEIEEIKIFTANDFAEYLMPKNIMSRDSLAVSQGLKTPPHISILSEINAIRSPFKACDKMAKLSLQAASHLERVSKNMNREERIGTNIFIGHGQSKEWKELKDFIQERLQLPWDEFNRKPIAGITNIARLSEMLDSAVFAFLVMTAEDEQADGSLQARMNVIHEAGLFQGRLGFNRAIVLLEEGCKEFSNIQGLGQIRFPKGNIKAVFEEIREVLERENIIESEK
ncbi:MAG: TIR domain-containing protein [Balneolaceae bacterium]